MTERTGSRLLLVTTEAIAGWRNVRRIVTDFVELAGLRDDPLEPFGPTCSATQGRVPAAL